MFKILKNKKGVTILEGLIALMLLAMVATGTFAVLLSTSRKTTTPDMREEMALAVDRASQLLQAYITPEDMDAEKDQVCYMDSSGEEECSLDVFSGGLCGGEDNPLTEGIEHHIECLLPPNCGNNSDFYYTVTPATASQTRNVDLVQNLDGESNQSTTPMHNIEFHISCNGYSL